MTGARAKVKDAAGKNTKEALKPADDRKVGKRKAAAGSGQNEKGKKAKKDPNQPKRPPSAFFVFLEEFRTTFKQENPNVKAVSAVGKAAGQKWKSMSEDEKSTYEAKAAKRKVEYEKQMNAYNKKQEDEELEKSKSEVNDEDEASGEEEKHQPEDEDDEDLDDDEDDD